MKAAFYTLGCKVNQYETETIREKFRQRGYEIVSEDDPADVYVVNTCTVTNMADRKSRQFIRKAHKLNPDAVIAVTGCYAQMDKEAVASIEGVDIVTGTDEKSRIFELVQEALEGNHNLINVKQYDQLNKYEELGLISEMEGRTRAFIKIQEGCDRFCSYCIIPFARGKVRSRARDEIVSEVSSLVRRGYKEIVLTGINTALYGTDFGYGGIAPLIESLDEMPSDFRIRLSSLEPTVVDADYAVGLLKYDRLCHHLHLSAQSGSDHVLAAMNRHYTHDDYLSIVRRLREQDPYYGISADIIVGFPGETEEDFEDSVRLVREAELVKTHVFKYSVRRGTRAAGMADQIDEKIKNRRSKILIAEAEEVQRKFLEKCRGTVRRVLLEREEDGMLTGYTDNYIKVYVPAGEIERAATKAGGFDIDRMSSHALADGSEADGTRAEIGGFADVRLGELYEDGMSGEITDL